MTTAKTGFSVTGSKPVQIFSDTIADGALAVSTDGLSAYKVLLVTVALGAEKTTSPTVTLDSGLGAAYDCVVNTIVITAGKYGTWQPTGEIKIAPADVLTVDVADQDTTIGVAIYCEAL